MNEQPDEREKAAAPRPAVRRLRRIGCGLLLVVWFIFLMVPCFFLTLAFQEEIVISQGDLPNQEIRIRLIMDADQRGFGLWTTSTMDGLEDDTCLITTVRYVLWQGEGEAVQYCDCYQRQGEDESSWIASELTCPGFDE